MGSRGYTRARGRGVPAAPGGLGTETRPRGRVPADLLPDGGPEDPRRVAALPRLVGLPGRDPARGGAAGRPRITASAASAASRSAPAARAAAATGPTPCRCPTARPAAAPGSAGPGAGARAGALTAAGLAADRLLEVRDQVLGGLDPAREPHQVGRHRRRRVLDRLVGHRLRHLDQRLDPAQRLGEREDLASGAAIAVASGWRKETMPQKPGQRTSSTPGARAQPFAHRARRSRCGERPAAPGCGCRGGRGSSRTAPGRRRPRSGRSGSARAARSSAVTVAPPTTSEWPPRYLVVECTTAVAPSSSGRWTTGVAKVLSTTTVRPSARLDHGGDVDLVEQRVRRRLDPDQPRLGTQRRAQGVEVASGRRGRRRGRSGRAPCRPAGRCRRRGRAAGSGGRRRRAPRSAGRAWRPSRWRRRRRGRPRARPGPARAPRGSGSPSASSRSPRRTRPARAGRRSRSGGSAGSPSRRWGRARGRRARPWCRCAGSPDSLIEGLDQVDRGEDARAPARPRR